MTSMVHTGQHYNIIKSTIHITGPVLWNSLDDKLKSPKIFIVLNVNIKSTAGLIHWFFLCYV